MVDVVLVVVEEGIVLVPFSHQTVIDALTDRLTDSNPHAVRAGSEIA